MSGANEIVDVVEAFIEDSGLMHPPEDVASAVAPRHPHVLAHRDRDRSTRAADLVRELNTGCGGSDDENRSVIEVIRGAIRHRRHLRVLARVAHAGEPALPVRRQQAQRVPPFGAP